MPKILRSRFSAVSALPLLLGVSLVASPGRAQNAPVPAAPPASTASAEKKIEGVTVLHDVTYLAPDRKEKLDLYLPSGYESSTAARYPGIVIIHGGGWTGGLKSATREIEEGTTLARAGYVCASIEYRLDAHNRWPTNVYDCKNAVRFLRAKADKYHIDAAHIGVLGGSAGGHLALMVGLTHGNPKLTPTLSDTPYPGVSDKVNAVVDMYGITDVRTRKKIEKDGTPIDPPDLTQKSQVFGDYSPVTEADRSLASPVDHIGANTPPVLILQGTSDTTVDRDQSITLDKKLTEANIPHKLILIPGVGHTFDLETWNKKPLPQDLRPTVVAFFNTYLKPGAATKATDAAPQTAPKEAGLTLGALFGDNVVLQRNAPITLWGHAAPDESVTVSLNGQTVSTRAFTEGNWKTALPAQKEGGPYTLIVTGDKSGHKVTRTGVLIGDVFLCSGQSNMVLSLGSAKNGAEAIAQASAKPDTNLRLFTVGRANPETPLSDTTGDWKTADGNAAKGFSAVGYYFGRELRRAHPDVPIGLIGAYVGGTPAQAWTREAALYAVPDMQRRYIDTYPADLAAHDAAMRKYEVALAQAKRTGKKAPQKPYGFWRYASLYNGMIAPLAGFALRGVVWYQGETNAKDPTGYRTLLPTLITDWRAQWDNPTLPFLLVQLPPFGTQAGNGLAWAEMREIQAQTAQKLPNVAYVVTTDVGTQHSIHPTNKEPVGARLALAARKNIYKEAGVVAFGPTYKSVKFEGSKVVITFDNAESGLVIRGGMASDAPVSETELTGFTVAGSDGAFVPAQARIVGQNTVEVSSSTVAAPRFVRYGFVNFPVLNLWNKNDLPTAPFRTDILPLP